MNTCADCEWWEKLPSSNAGLCGCVGAFPVPRCDTLHKTSTWAAFPACLHFRLRSDWADKAAKRIFDGVMDSVAKSHPCLGYTKEAADEWKRTTAQAIREEAAKAGVK